MGALDIVLDIKWWQIRLSYRNKYKMFLSFLINIIGIKIEPA